MRGSNNKISVQKCSAADWVAVAVYALVMALMVYVSSRLNKFEYDLK